MAKPLSHRNTWKAQTTKKVRHDQDILQGNIHRLAEHERSKREQQELKDAKLRLDSLQAKDCLITPAGMESFIRAACELVERAFARSKAAPVLLLLFAAVLVVPAHTQTTDKCREAMDSETICTFADGSATVVWHPAGTYESTHYTAAQWKKDGPAIEDQARRESDAIAEQQNKEYRANVEDIARLDAKAKAEMAKSDAEFEASRALGESETKAGTIHNKKQCRAAGFVWDIGNCWAQSVLDAGKRQKADQQ